MGQYRYIYWRKDISQKDGKSFANVHLLIGYNQATIKDLQEMADELRETFPQATDDKIRGGKVFMSSYVNGFTVVAWNGHIPRAEYPGWDQIEDGKVEYKW